MKALKNYIIDYSSPVSPYEMFLVKATSKRQARVLALKLVNESLIKAITLESKHPHFA